MVPNALPAESIAPNGFDGKQLKKVNSPRIVGLIPAAGSANRISPLPCSKELYPIGFRSINEEGDLRPKVASHYVLEGMRRAGAHMAFFILRDGKWDIPAYFQSGSILDMSLAYLVVGPTGGVPYTLDQAYPFIKDATVLLGFPDILLSPQDAFAQAVSRLRESTAEIVLGLFPAHNPQKVDMVELHHDGRVKNLQIKPQYTELIYTWSIAVWNPSFSIYLHDYIFRSRSEGQEAIGEMFMGHVINDAVAEGMTAETVVFSTGSSLDIGTSDDLLKALHAEMELLTFPKS